MAYTIELYANNARTTLAGSANNTVTTLVLQSGAGTLFPSPNNLIGEYAKATLQDAATGLRNEIVYITARTGDVLTVVRGQDGSAAQTWSAGDTAFEGVTAATLASFVQPSKLQSGQYVFATATGTTTAYNAALTPAVAVLTDGMIISVDTSTVGTNTTTNPTLNVNGLGVITIVKEVGALRVGDMPKFAQLQYNATLTQWELLNPVGLVGIIASAINTVTGTSTLTKTQFGGTVVFNVATANVQTLPAASTIPAGYRMEIMSIGAGISTLTRAGSDALVVSSTTRTAIPLGNGDTAVIESDGISKYYVVGGSVQTKYAYNNRSLLAAAGYKFHPDGFIEQWLYGVTTSGVGAFTFPITFPTFYLGGSCSLSNDTFMNAPCLLTLGNTGASGGRVIAGNGAGGATAYGGGVVGYFVKAWGY